MNNRILLFFVFINAFTLKSQIISEICSSNSACFETETEGYSDWVEIENNTGSTLDLSGFYLANDTTMACFWEIPEIEMGIGERIIFAAVKGNSTPETINFSFSRLGGNLYLLNADTEIIDSVNYPKLSRNHTYGKIEDKWYYFDIPSPLEANATQTGYKGYAMQPIINRISGAYSKGTSIEFQSQDNSQLIYYKKNGYLDLMPIANGGSLVLNETINIKAITKGDSLIDSEVTERIYFVDINSRLPIVNLSLDSLELFDETDGIYRMGPDADPDFPFYGANFWEDKKIEAYYSYFNEEINLIEELGCDIKIHGGVGSRGRPMKSIQLRASSAFDQSKFRHAYFDEKETFSFSRLVLRNAGNDFCHSCIKDGTLQKYFTMQNLNVDMLGFKPVILYVNGNYWGIHNIREKADKHYLKSNYDVNPDDVNLLEGWSLAEVEGSSAGFDTIVEYITNNDLAVDEHYKWVSNRVDINSMVDYFIIELYTNNRDWPNNNLKIWNAPTHKKWRYICYDLDVGLRYLEPELLYYQNLVFILANYSVSNPHVRLLKALLTNYEFKRYFVNRYCDLLNTTFERNQFFEAIKKDKENLEVDMPKHYTKWCGPIDIWNSRFNGIKGFIDGRVGLIHEELSDVFEYTAPVEISVNVYPANYATVILNTLKLDEFPFNGMYYPSNKIELTVQVKQGVEFDYWENIYTGVRFYEQHILVDPNFKDHYVAVCKSTENLFHLSTFPNPFQNEFQLNFSIPESGNVEIHLVDIQGRYIKEFIFAQELKKGGHSILLDLSSFQSGSYFLIMKTAYGKETCRLLKI